MVPYAYNKLRKQMKINNFQERWRRKKTKGILFIPLWLIMDELLRMS